MSANGPAAEPAGQRRPRQWRCPLCQRPYSTETGRIAHMDIHNQAWRQVLTLTDRLTAEVAAAGVDIDSRRTLSGMQVANALGIRVNTLNHYTRLDLLPCDRTPGGHRRFNLNEVRATLAGAAEARDLPADKEA